MSKRSTIEQRREERRRYLLKHPEQIQKARDRARAWEKKQAAEDPEYLYKKAKKHRDKHPDRVRARQAAWREKNRERHNANAAEWRRRNPESAKASLAKYAAANKEKRVAYNAATKERRLANEKRRMATDLHYALSRRLRSRIKCALKWSGAMKSIRTAELIGCSIPELKAHLESRFKVGMSWENRSLWHMDHVIALAKFDLTKESDQRAAFHYTNLQPLWASENLRKWKN